MASVWVLITGWAMYDVVIMGSLVLGGSPQCWHLRVSVLALERFSAGT